MEFTEPFSGVHTLGGAQDINHLISFASFKEDGLEDFATHIEDLQERFLDKISRFHCLEDHKGCGDVKSFLRATKQSIIQTQQEQSKTGLYRGKPETSLFLHDWPGNNDVFGSKIHEISFSRNQRWCNQRTTKNARGNYAKIFLVVHEKQQRNPRDGGKAAHNVGKFSYPRIQL